MDIFHVDSAVGGTDHLVVCKPDRSLAGRPVVLFAHGLGGSSTGVAGAVEYGQTLLAEKYGIPTFSSDLAGDSWGAAADSRVASVLSYASSRYGCDITRIAFICQSMGNFTAWTYLADHASTVKGVASLLPANDLAGYYANATYTASIDTAYGGTADAGEITAHDPKQREAAIVTALAGKPAPQIWANLTAVGQPGEDTIVTAASASAFATAIGADLHNQGAVGHTPQGHDPALIAAYIAGCLAAS